MLSLIFWLYKFEQFKSKKKAKLIHKKGKFLTILFFYKNKK